MNKLPSNSNSRFGRRKFFLIGLVVLPLLLLAAIACQPSELTPRGNWSGAVLVGDFAYSVNNDGRILRFSTTNSGPQNAGQLDTNWTYPSSAQQGIGVSYTPAVVDESGTVLYATGYRCSASGGANCVSQIAAIEIEGPNQLWLRPLNTRITSAPTIYQTTLVVATSDQINDTGANGVLLGLNKNNSGAELWRLDLDDAVWGDITIDANGVAYVATLSGTLYAFDLANAGTNVPNILWQYNVGDALAAKPLVDNGNVYIGSLGGNGTFYAFNLAARLADPQGNGGLQSNEWSFDMGAWVWAEALIINSTIYVGTIEGQLYALNAANGSPTWPMPASFNSPIIARVGALDNSGNTLLAVPLYDSANGIMLVSAATGNLSGSAFNTVHGVAAPPLADGQFLFVQNLRGLTMVFNVNTAALQSCGTFATSNNVSTISPCSNN